MSTKITDTRKETKRAIQIEIADGNNPSKVHCFRYYADGHVTYNQRILNFRKSGESFVFYPKWQRCNRRGFGYAEYLVEADNKRANRDFDHECALQEAM